MKPPALYCLDVVHDAAGQPDMADRVRATRRRLEAGWARLELVPDL